MKIYHYTSIQTLALILKNKTIKFNRLDKVNDMEEAEFAYGGYTTAGKYVFVSCWNHPSNDKENIALWKMYTDLKGVRIGIEKDDLFTISNQGELHLKSYGDKPYVHENKPYLRPVKLDESKYVIQPDKNYFSKIQYLTDDEIGSYCGLVLKDMDAEYENLGICKRDIWQHEEECRFKIVVLPHDERGCVNGIQYQINKLPDLEDTFLLVPLKDGAVDKMEITLGPLCEEEERIIVEALRYKYAPSSPQVEKSKLRIRGLCEKNDNDDNDHNQGQTYQDDGGDNVDDSKNDINDKVKP